MGRFTSFNRWPTKAGDKAMKTYGRWLVSFVLALALIWAGVVFYNNTMAAKKRHVNNDVKGLHGGQLLSEGNISVEMTVFERGMPPHFRVYVYRNNKPLSPKKVSLQVTLKRFGSESNAINFEPIHEF